MAYIYLETKLLSHDLLNCLWIYLLPHASLIIRSSDRILYIYLNTFW